MQPARDVAPGTQGQRRRPVRRGAERGPSPSAQWLVLRLYLPLHHLPAQHRPTRRNHPADQGRHAERPEVRTEILQLLDRRQARVLRRRRLAVRWQAQGKHIQRPPGDSTVRARSVSPQPEDGTPWRRSPNAPRGAGATGCRHSADPEKCPRPEPSPHRPPRKWR